jgi:hypothetical protein
LDGWHGLAKDAADWLEIEDNPVKASERAAGRRSGTVRGFPYNSCIAVYTPLFKQLATDGALTSLKNL